MQADFEKEYLTLNPRQKEAVDAIDGPVMVIAGPGTGKTKILILRIANILRLTDTPPEAILAITFTENAASEMRRRLAELIGSSAYRASITTFHGFCNRIIQGHPEDFLSSAGGTSLSEQEQAVRIHDALLATNTARILRPINAPDFYLKSIIHTIHDLKRESVTSVKLREIIKNERATVMNSENLHHEKGKYKGQMKGEYRDKLKQLDKLNELADVYEQYQLILASNREYDYDDMIISVANQLESNKDLSLLLQERFQYFLIDEHQDTNNSQNRIIESLSSFWEESPNIFVVGDEKQAIYRFQGASLENFHYFAKKFTVAKLITLDVNYRSTQMILDAAHNVRGSPNALKASAGHREHPIQLLKASDEDAERWAVLSHIQLRILDKTDPNQIAILCRENREVRVYANLCAKLNILADVSAEDDAFQDPLVHHVESIIRAISSFGDPVPFFEVLHIPEFHIDRLDLYKLAIYCRGKQNPYDVIRSPKLLKETGIANQAHIKEIVKLLESWAPLVREPKLLNLLAQIISESGILTLATSDNRPDEKVAVLHALYRLAGDSVARNPEISLDAFGRHLIFLRDQGIPLTISGTRHRNGHIQILTAHKSKGLEFDYVYLTGATDARWSNRARAELIRLPNSIYLRAESKSDFDKEHDELNLFFVALTRARKEVMISFASADSQDREMLQARAITDIRPELIIDIDPVPFEKDWQEHREVLFAQPQSETPDENIKQLIVERLKEGGFSVTALNQYLSCPWAWFYSSLLKIPEAPSFALQFGSIVDDALTKYMEQLRLGTKMSRDDLIAHFISSLDRSILRSSDRNVATERGIHALTGYYDRWNTSWHPNIINQLRIPDVPFVVSGELIVSLNGKIDKVELFHDHVVVVDYKTGSAKSRKDLLGATKTSNGNYFRQLVFYKLLLNGFNNGQHHATSGIIDFVEPDDRGKFHREEFDITKEHIKNLTETIKKNIKEMTSLAFWNKRCDDKKCKYCALHFR